MTKITYICLKTENYSNKKPVTTQEFVCWSSSPKSAPCSVQWRQVLWNWRYKCLKFSCDLMLVTSSKGHMSLRAGASQDKSAPFLVQCPLFFCKWRYNGFNLWHDLIGSSRGSCKFMAGNSLQYVTTLTSLVTIGIVKVEICF